MPEGCRDVPEVFVFQSIAKPALHGHEHERVMMAVRQGLQDADDRRQEAIASPRVTGWVTLTGPDTFQLRDTGGTTFKGRGGRRAVLSNRGVRPRRRRTRRSRSGSRGHSRPAAVSRVGSTSP